MVFTKTNVNERNNITTCCDVAKLIDLRHKCPRKGRKATTKVYRIGDSVTDDEIFMQIYSVKKNTTFEKTRCENLNITTQTSLVNSLGFKEIKICHDFRCSLISVARMSVCRAHTRVPIVVVIEPSC